MFRCFECKKNYKKDFNKELINIFSSAYEFCNEDINEYILLLRKDVYPYEYMDSWQRFNKTLLLDKEVFYSTLNMEDITDVDYRHAKRVFNVDMLLTAKKESEEEYVMQYTDMQKQIINI